MIDFLLPRELDTLEIAIRLRREITRRDSMVALRIEGEEKEYVIPGWPIYPPVGVAAKHVSLGQKGELQKFAIIRARALGGCRLNIDLLTDEGRPQAVSEVAVLGKTVENREFAWRFEV